MALTTKLNFPCKFFSSSFTSAELKWTQWFKFLSYAAIKFNNTYLKNKLALKKDDWQAKTCTKLHHQCTFRSGMNLNLHGVEISYPWIFPFQKVLRHFI